MKLRSLFILGLLLLSGSSMSADESKKTTYGYVEKAMLVDKGIVLSAKLDTGAKSASLNATRIYEIEGNNKPYLRFTVPCKAGAVEFTAEYIGKVKIKTRVGEHLTDGKAKLYEKQLIKRPLVLMRIKIGDKERNIAVNLTNRKRFNYPLLLGREAIKAFNGLVDPGQIFLIKTAKLQQNEVK